MVRCTTLLTLAIMALAIGTARVAAQYPAENVTLLSHLRLNQLGGGNGSDIWGWVDPLTDREYALLARSTGMSFVDVTDGTQPVYLGNLPSHTSGTEIWRDVKVYQNHAFIVSDGNGPHGLQVFDLTQLRGVTTPQTFDATTHFDEFRNAHNIAINEVTGFAYVVGSNRASGGLYILDVSNPTQPTYAGQFSQDGYSHDAQVVSYQGPDADYAGQEIAFGSNEDTLTVANVTDKSNTSQISRTSYNNNFYSHQGWLSEDHRYFFLGDELDEVYLGGMTRTHIFDVSDLDNPEYVGFSRGTTNAIDHNMYVKGNYIFQANYEAGLRILEMTDVANRQLTEVGFLDTFPSRTTPAFNGSWSVYPYFDNGKVIISDIQGGLFVAQFDLLATAPGDFDEDGMLSCTDIDLLVAAIANDSTELSFDLTGDGNIDLADRDAWLAEAGQQNLSSGNPYLLGDANLNGAVDTSDFNVWNTNKFTATAAWCTGDLNADGIVDTSDFNIWNGNKFQSSGGTTVVPEPEFAALLWVCGWIMGGAGRRRKRLQ